MREYKIDINDKRLQTILSGKLITVIPKPKINEVNEIYQHKCGYSDVNVLVSKDTRDGVYYNYAQWHKEPHFTECVGGWELSDIQTVYDIININPLNYVEYSKRKYNQPKLNKPKELKGIKAFSKAEFIDKHSSPQLYAMGDDVWIKHTDYFSPSWRPPEGERIDMPLNYYLNKYFNKSRKAKFTYEDCWGEIVLRCEAWLKIENLISIIKFELLDKKAYHWLAEKIFVSQYNVVKYERVFKRSGNDYWIRFWEDVVKETDKYLMTESQKST